VEQQGDESNSAADPARQQHNFECIMKYQPEKKRAAYQSKQVHFAVNSGLLYFSAC